MDGEGVVIPLRKRTRETLRHERATVLQELGTPSAAAVRADWEANKIRNARVRRAALRRGGEPDGHGQLGLVTSPPVAGGNGSPPPQCTCNGWGCLACGGWTS